MPTRISEDDYEPGVGWRFFDTSGYLGTINDDGEFVVEDPKPEAP